MAVDHSNTSGGTAEPVPAKPPPPQPGELWHRTQREVLDSEIKTINLRRDANEAARNKDDKTSVPFTHVVVEEHEPLDVVGLALSGGGIRSAAVCLGVLQALNNYRLLPHIDYLSTVSGGGYIGSAWSAAVAQGDSKFPFGDLAADKPREQLARDKPTADEVSDTPSVAHIRNYSNFIIPGGFRDLLTGLAIVFRGLAVNFAIVLPLILFVAALTISSNPKRSLLTVTDIFGFATGDKPWWWFLAGFSIPGLILGAVIKLLRRYKKQDGVAVDLGGYLALTGIWIGCIGAFATLLSVQSFGVTLAAILLTLVALAGWGLWRSAKPDGSEFRGYAATAGAIALVLIVVIAFFEAQPFVLDAMFAAYEVDPEANSLTGAIAGWIKSLTAATASVTVIVTFFRDKLASVLKSDGSSSTGGIAKAFVAKAAIWLGSLALPLLIWIGYLHLSMWGVVNDKSLPPCPPAVQQSCTAPAPQPSDGKCTAPRAPAPAAACRLHPPKKPDGSLVDPEIAHVPPWLTSLSTQLNLGAAAIYFIFGFLLLLLSLLFEPNANSLHRLYRDRLGKAFLFSPSSARDERNDFPENDTQKLSALSETAAPYQLIGAALNIQGSTFANRRGRNADFFMFSRNRTGSEATGYVDTTHFEPTLDLATAIAISGAAASSNMGAASIRPLTPTLTLLNIRLGYWLRNPRYYPTPTDPSAVKKLADEPVKSGGEKKSRWSPQRSSVAYLWQELTGRLYEDADSVYLTDGGHIENLGIYELLRRRCKVIIAVDAEADPEMHMPSFVTLQRYARIDLGIIIDLPWSPIRERTLAVMANNATAQPKNDSQPGPHVAIGTINYGGGKFGYLVYIKSSLSGDENDYVRDYARRFSTFPHEATIEQFFSEEQFEVYRALGFHMTHGWLKPKDADDVVVDDGIKPCALHKMTDKVDALEAIKTALRWPPPAAAANSTTNPAPPVPPATPQALS